MNTRIVNADNQSRMSGIVFRPAYDCCYPPAIEHSDIISVDFDTRRVDSDGLYLVEELQGSCVVWRGCRRFRIEPGSKAIELDAKGDDKSWMCFDAAASQGWRIAGKVLKVYRITN